MTTIRVALLDGEALRQGGAELIDGWASDGSDRLWVDIQDPTENDLEELLEKRFGFHELAAEDSLSNTTLPKYDRFTNYDFFIFRAVDVDLNNHASQTYSWPRFSARTFSSRCIRCRCEGWMRW